MIEIKKTEMSVCNAIKLNEMIATEGLSKSFALPVKIKAGY